MLPAKSSASPPRITRCVEPILGVLEGLDRDEVEGER